MVRKKNVQAIIIVLGPAPTQKFNTDMSTGDSKLIQIATNVHEIFRLFLFSYRGQISIMSI